MEWPCTAVCETWLLNWNSLFWSGFSAVWGDVLSGCQVLVGSVLGPCHLWEFLYMRSADMCVWWRCVWVDRYYVLTFGSGGACSTKGSSDFWLLTLWSVDGCRIMCCVHHCVSLYCGWRNTACWDGPAPTLACTCFPEPPPPWTEIPHSIPALSIPSATVKRNTERCT
jgi:hypothetical protein